MEITKYNLLQLTQCKTKKDIQIPECNTSETKLISCLAGSNVSDAATLGGKNIDMLGNVSDEYLETIFNGDSNTEVRYSKTYREFQPDEIRHLRQLIYDYFKGNKTNPENPENPTPENPSPENPENPTEPGEDGENDPLPKADETISLTRKGSTQKTQTIQAGKTYTLEVKNLVGRGKETYRYSITSNTGSNVSNVKFEVLDNGRLYISGTGIKVVAESGQDDDIILIGNGNELETGNGSDTVRVGCAIDSSGISSNQSDGNKINTGSGDDYIISFGLNTVTMGPGKDKLCSAEKDTDDHLGEEFLFAFTADMSNNIDNRTRTDYFDNKIDGGYQAGYGDCKLLAFINSLNKAGELGKYVNITKSGSNYNVQFKKSGESVNISKSDFTVDSAYGDIDFVLIETAFRKLIEQLGYNMNNETNDKSLGMSTNNFLIYEIFYGQSLSDSQKWPTWCNNTSENFVKLLEAYKKGEISNLVVGSNDSKSGKPQNEKVGIMYNHAYAVIDGKANEYVVLINPHDGNDRIILDWDDYFKYFSNINLFGDTFEYYYGNSATAAMEMSDPIVCCSDNSESELMQSQIDMIMAEENMKKGVLELYS